MTLLPRKLMVALAFGFFATAAQAATIDIDTTAPNRGWFNDIGLGQTLNDNTFTGTVDSNPNSGSGRGLNSFFIWDLSGVSGTIQSATVTLGIDRYFSSDASETLAIYDVSTSISDLTSNHAANSASGLAIHSDLQSGSLYDIVNVLSTDTTVTIDLTAALAEIQSALGTSFAIGVHSQTDSGADLDGLRFDQTPRLQRLTIEVATIPLPASGLLLIAGMAGLGLMRRRR